MCWDRRGQGKLNFIFWRRLFWGALNNSRRGTAVIVRSVQIHTKRRWISMTQAAHPLDLMKMYSQRTRSTDHSCSLSSDPSQPNPTSAPPRERTHGPCFPVFLVLPPDASQMSRTKTTEAAHPHLLSTIKSRRALQYTFCTLFM